MKEPLITIIVPIYNVEDFLEDCIRSLSNQSYKNLEIILVNDGSDDKSGNIADSLALKDERIIVTHQGNSGVSMARNNGLDSASGEYICFVDADDWLSPTFVEDLLSLSLNHNADFVVSENVLNSPVAVNCKEETIRIWSNEDAVETLLHADVIIGCWNKLYKRDLIESHHLRFLPKFFMGEGLNFITHYAQVASKIVTTSKPNYYYRRNNSESATTKKTIIKLQNALLAIQNIRDNKILLSSRFDIAVDYHEWRTRLDVVRFLNIEKSFPQQNKLYQDCYEFIKSHAFKLLISSKVSKRRKAIILAVLVMPKISFWLAKRKDKK